MEKEIYEIPKVKYLTFNYERPILDGSGTPGGSEDFKSGGEALTPWWQY